MGNGGALSVAAIVTAAGSSARIQASHPGVKKEYRMLPGHTDGNGKPLTVLGAAVSAFAEVPAVSKIIVTVPPDRDNAQDEARAALPPGLSGIFFVRGGKNRRASVYHALRYLQASGGAGGEQAGLVLVHDGARPWVSVSLINAVIGAARVHGAAIPILPAVETPKILDNLDTRRGALSGFITQHLRRENVVFAQTPQGFLFGPFIEAHEKAAAKTDGMEFTDDAEVWAFAWPERKVAAVPGEAANKKITFPEDLPLINVFPTNGPSINAPAGGQVC